MRIGIIGLLVILWGCPDPEEFKEEVGGAPRRQIEATGEKVKDSAKAAEDRINKAMERVDDE